MLTPFQILLKLHLFSLTSFGSITPVCVPAIPCIFSDAVIFYEIVLHRSGGGVPHLCPQFQAVCRGNILANGFFANESEILLFYRISALIHFDV